VQLTISEIIKITGGEVTQGSEELNITGVSSLDEATISEVSFLGNEKYFQDFLNTSAGAVFIPSNFPGGLPQVPQKPTLIAVENPSMAFAAVVKVLATKQRTFTPGIHPLASIADDVIINPEKVSVKAGAVIESGCTVGNGSEIGSNVVISEGATIGEDCLIYPNVTIREHCSIGDRVILQPGAVIGSDGYGYELVEGKHVKVDQVGIVVIENDVEIGANTTIDRARFGKTVIGEGTKIDNLVQVAHNVIIGKHCLIVAQTGLSGSCKIGSYVTIAGQSAVVGHIEIGDKAVLTGKSAATKPLPGDTIYSGIPARPITEFQRKNAALAKLPQLMKDFKALQKRIAELEKS